MHRSLSECSVGQRGRKAALEDIFEAVRLFSHLLLTTSRIDVKIFASVLERRVHEETSARS